MIGWSGLGVFFGLSQDHTLVRYDARGSGLSDWDVTDSRSMRGSQTLTGWWLLQALSGFRSSAYRKDAQFL
jgi:hypothetical protein